jgi:hypothetical protein
LHWKAQGDLEEPLEEALEEDAWSLEGDFNSDFVHDLKVGTVADMLINCQLACRVCCYNLEIHFYTNV